MIKEIDYIDNPRKSWSYTNREIYVFISHSHEDAGKVRVIRNLLEENGFQPLMFFLKCLSDEDEVEDLIKREINERKWFIYADSYNARKSKWVKTEREYIEELRGKYKYRIDLDQDVAKQVGRIIYFMDHMKVYISCARKDYEIRNRIARNLYEEELTVISDKCVYDVNGEWIHPIDEITNEDPKTGFVIVLFSENSVKSIYVREEILEAIRVGGTVISVCVGDVKIPSEIDLLLGCVNPVTISEVPTDAEIDLIFEAILDTLENYICE